MNEIEFLWQALHDSMLLTCVLTFIFGILFHPEIPNPLAH